MKFKREEAFRFAFGEPINASFQIVQIDHRTVESSTGNAQILDISPEGLRIQSTLDIPEVSSKQIMLAISFKINETEFSENGIIVWKKTLGNKISYGLNLQLDEEKKEKIISELKIYTKNNMK